MSEYDTPRPERRTECTHPSLKLPTSHGLRTRCPFCVTRSSALGVLLSGNSYLQRILSKR